MKVFDVVRFTGRAAILAVVMTATLGATAWADAGPSTLDPTGPLSPGHLHVYLTGTTTCEAGDSASLYGQVVQSKAGGFGSTGLVCSGAPQAWTIDVSAGGGFPGSAAAAFKPGKASAGLTTTVCEPFVFPDPITDPFPPLPMCSTTPIDAMIRVVK